MDLDDIQRVLDLSRERCLRVRLGAAPGIPGYVQSVFICSGNVVRIEYEVYGMDEGGAYYEATYPSLEAAVGALEAFTATSRAEWPRNLLRPDTMTRPSSSEIQAGHAALQRAIRAGAVPLPTGAKFVLRSSYWGQFEAKAT